MANRILVVDDEPDLQSLVKQRFRKQIKLGELEFVFALNGMIALEALRADSEICLVMSDINMPVMDGLALLAAIVEKHPDVKTVIVSAYGDLNNIRIAMNRGAFDFLTKPIDFDDFERTMRKAMQTQAELKRAKTDRETLGTLHRELQVAAKIQQSMLPLQLPKNPAFDAYATMIPANEVGGDFYDCFQLPDGRLGIAVGDVSGKGVPAAIFMAMSITLLRGMAMQGLEPRACVTAVNDQLSLGNSTGMFVTLFYGIMDLTSGCFKFTIAGHNPPYLLKKDRIVVLNEPVGMLAGAFERNEYEEGVAWLEPGDALFLYTDGVTEAHNSANLMYDESRLEVCLRKHVGTESRRLCEEVLADVQAFAGGFRQSDDITAMALRWLQPL